MENITNDTVITHEIETSNIFMEWHIYICNNEKQIPMDILSSHASMIYKMSWDWRI